MGRPRSVNLHNVCRSVGVVLRPGVEFSNTSLRARHCYCAPTLRAIGLQHGEIHLSLVLRLIVESKGNDCALHAGTVLAVSNLIASGKVVVDGALFEAFDDIDLSGWRQWAYENRVGRASVAETLTAALLLRLCPPKPRTVTESHLAARQAEKRRQIAAKARRAQASLSVAA